MMAKMCLLLEDDADDRNCFLDVLRSVSESAKCYTASHGEEALLCLAMEKFIPDIIFTDINMPRMGGLEFLKRFRKMKKFSHVPVVIYSGEYVPVQEAELVDLGVIAVYVKERKVGITEILEKYFSATSHDGIL